MTTYSLNPTYFQVTWDNLTPNDYSSLTGNQNGGLDSETSWQINSLIMTTGTTELSGTPLNDGDTIVINGYSIAFLSSDDIFDIIYKINLASKITNVAANQMVAGGYVTLMNAPGTEGTAFWLQEGTGTALADLGLTAGTYSNYPFEVGTTFTPVTTDSNITLNGITIQFTGGPLTPSDVATQLNAQATATGVYAYAAGPYLQLATNGQSWSINSGNAVANMGFVAGNHGGSPATLANSEAKERANMRWTQMIAEIESVATPIKLGNIERTGNVGNVATDSITFTVGYNQPDSVRTVAREDEPDNGVVFIGADAIKRGVARAMVATMRSNRKLFDPTLQSYGAYCDRPNAARIMPITAEAIDIVDNVTIVEQNITVTQIAGV